MLSTARLACAIRLATLTLLTIFYQLAIGGGVFAWANDGGQTTMPATQTSAPTAGLICLTCEPP